MSEPRIEPATTHRSRFEPVGFYGALGATGLATVGLLVLAANPLAALVPVGLVALGALAARAPLRSSASVLLLLLLAIDMSEETSGHWRTPLVMLGDLLHFRIDQTLPIPGANISGMELAIVVLLGIRVYRVAKGVRIDEVDRVETASVVRDLLALYVAGILVAEVVGLARGWGAGAYKLRILLHPALLVALFAACYRGPRDAHVVGRIVVFSACAKGVLAHVVQRIARAETGGMYNSAVGHGDSVLFAVAAFLIAIRFLEEPRRAFVLPGLVMLGLVVLGCIENDRRLVWVMMAMSTVFAYLLRPLAGWQRLVTRTVIIAVPVLLAYFAIGWNSGSRLFGPVQTFRGVADTSHDTSAYWREVEIWNIATSMRSNPLLGMGLGGEYTETMFNDDISAGYPEYREWPHNTILGLLMLMGLFAFTAHWLVFPATLFLAARSYRMARSAEDRIIAQGCAAAMVSCLVLAWGDCGAHYPAFQIFAALALAFAAKLAVATGAWPRSRSRAAGVAA